MRATMHNGRTHANGQPFSAHHNDRDFDTSKHDTIDPSKVGGNLYWSTSSGGWYRDAEKGEHPTFAEVERQYYEETFTEQWERQCELNRSRGQGSRNKSFEKWRSTRRYVPEEQHLQIGDVAEHATPEQLTDAVNRYLNAILAWNRSNGEPFELLDVAFHLEESTPHVQLRRVWKYNDEQGVCCIGQERALEQAGVELPDPSKPEAKNNHRKKTFDQFMRQTWLDCVQKAGIEVEREPLPNHRSRDKGQWLHMQRKEFEREMASQRAEMASTARGLDERSRTLDEREEALKSGEDALKRDNERLERKQVELQRQAERLGKVKQELQAVHDNTLSLLNAVQVALDSFPQVAVDLYGHLEKDEFEAEVGVFALEYTEDERNTLGRLQDSADDSMSAAPELGV